MNFFDHKNLGNRLLQLCPEVVKHPVYNWLRCTVHSVKPAIYAKRKCLSSCAERNALFGLLISQITILAPVILQESPMSHYWLTSWERDICCQTTCCVRRPSAWSMTRMRAALWRSWSLGRQVSQCARQEKCNCSLQSDRHVFCGTATC